MFILIQLSKMHRVQRVKTILFVKQMTEISDEDINLIIQARQTVLSDEGIPWVKKERN